MKATHQTKNQKNHYLAEARSAKLTLKGDGDAFWFKSQSRMKSTHETINQKNC
jgi:hypothetical protein